MALFAGVGVLGGLLRDLAPDPEEIWRFSPFLDLSFTGCCARSQPSRTRVFHLVFLRPSCSPNACAGSAFICSEPPAFSRCIRPENGARRLLFAVFIYHRFRRHPAAENLERHPQRGETRIAAASAQRSHGSRPSPGKSIRISFSTHSIRSHPSSAPTPNRPAP